MAQSKLSGASKACRQFWGLVQFYFVLLDRIKKYITERAMETD